MRPRAHLDVAQQVALNGGESDRTKDICSQGKTVLVSISVWESQVTAELPNSLTRDSAASRNSVVEIALSLDSSMGTSLKDLFMVSSHVPPSGATEVEAMAAEGIFGESLCDNS